MEGYFGAGQSITPGWYPDPAGRFEQRYWNGAAWTEQVMSRGVPGYDPLPPAPPAIPQQTAYSGLPSPPTLYGPTPGTPPPYGGASVQPSPHGGAPVQPYAFAPAPTRARSARRMVAALVGAAGGTLVIAATYMNWLSGGFLSVSGWDLYDLRAKMGGSTADKFIVTDMFGSGTPFFTGLTTLIIGIAVVVAALLLALALAAQGSGGSGGGASVLSLLASLMAIVASAVATFNLVMWTVKGNDQGVDAAAGLYLVLAGSLVAMFALGLAAKR